MMAFPTLWNCLAHLQQAQDPAEASAQERTFRFWCVCVIHSLWLLSLSVVVVRSLSLLTGVVVVVVVH
jgi:hypothetical protein